MYSKLWQALRCTQNVQVLKQMHTGEPAVNNFGAQAGKKKMNYGLQQM